MLAAQPRSWQPEVTRPTALQISVRHSILRVVGQAEDEIRIDAEDALGAIDGLEVRRVFSGWGFYQRGLLFGAAWEGEFRFRTRRGGRWIYEPVDRELLDQPDTLVAAARAAIAKLRTEPAATVKHRRSGPA
jgi:TfoX/Sxy family transcriptional regulator of competence genes